MKYIISVHSNKYGDCYGGYDNGQFGSGYPTITTNLSYMAEFDSVELAKKMDKGLSAISAARFWELRPKHTLHL